MGCQSVDPAAGGLPKQMVWCARLRGEGALRAWPGKAVGKGAADRAENHTHRWAGCVDCRPNRAACVSECCAKAAPALAWRGFTRWTASLARTMLSMVPQGAISPQEESLG